MNRKQRYNEDPEYREKTLLQSKKYYQKNKEKLNGKSCDRIKKKYHDDDDFREAKKNYQIIYQRKYNMENREKKAEINRKYREKIKAKKEAEKMKNLYIEDENLKIQI